jgi:acyl-CoA synthetase (AMP-forming)/AMP-acid ligase II
VGEVDVSVIEAFCSERLPRFMVPKKWVEVEKIPRTSLGKPDRRAAAASSLGDDG